MSLISSLAVACSFSVPNQQIDSSNLPCQRVVTARLTNFGGFAKAKVAVTMRRNVHNSLNLNLRSLILRLPALSAQRYGAMFRQDHSSTSEICCQYREQKI